MPLLILLLLLIPFSAPAKKNTLRLKKPEKHVSASRPETSEGSDSLLLADFAPLITFSGFDKPWNSTKETFLVSNNSTLPLKGLRLQISYFDPRNRMLHSREITLELEVPPGETRQANVKSFDTQKSFYYIKSKAPRSGGQPFEVRIKILSIGENTE